MKTLALLTLSLTVGLPACEERSVDRSGALCMEMQSALAETGQGEWTPSTDVLIAAPYRTGEELHTAVVEEDRQLLIDSSNGQENVLVASLANKRVKSICHLDSRFDVSPSVFLLKAGEGLVVEALDREYRPLVLKARALDTGLGTQRE